MSRSLPREPLRWSVQIAGPSPGTEAASASARPILTFGRLRGRLLDVVWTLSGAGRPLATGRAPEISGELWRVETHSGTSDTPLESAPSTLDVEWSAVELDQGELPLPIALTLGGPSEITTTQATLHATSDPGVALGSVRVPVRAAADPEDETSLADRFDQRRAVIEARAALDRYFIDLDRLTRGTDAESARATAGLLHRLDHRQRVRRAHALRSPALVPRFPSPLPPTAKSRRLVEQLRRLSELFEDLERQHLEPHGALLGFDHAYQSFVLGDLAVRHPTPSVHSELFGHGTPDGALYTLFPEVALQCIEADVDRARWRARLPSLVRTAHLALEQAAPRRGAPPFEVGSFRFGPGSRLSGAREALVRHDFDQLIAHASTGTTDGIEPVDLVLAARLGLLLRDVVDGPIIDRPLDGWPIDQQLSFWPGGRPPLDRPQPSGSSSA